MAFIRNGVSKDTSLSEKLKKMAGSSSIFEKKSAEKPTIGSSSSSLPFAQTQTSSQTNQLTSNIFASPPRPLGSTLATPSIPQTSSFTSSQPRPANNSILQTTSSQSTFATRQAALGFLDEKPTFQSPAPIPGGTGQTFFTSPYKQNTAVQPDQAYSFRERRPNPPNSWIYSPESPFYGVLKTIAPQDVATYKPIDKPAPVSKPIKIEDEITAIEIKPKAVNIVYREPFKNKEVNRSSLTDNPLLLFEAEHQERETMNHLHEERKSAFRKNLKGEMDSLSYLHKKDPEVRDPNKDKKIKEEIQVNQDFQIKKNIMNEAQLPILQNIFQPSSMISITSPGPKLPKTTKSVLDDIDVEITINFESCMFVPILMEASLLCELGEVSRVISYIFSSILKVEVSHHPTLSNLIVDGKVLDLEMQLTPSQILKWKNDQSSQNVLQMELLVQALAIKQDCGFSSSARDKYQSFPPLSLVNGCLGVVPQVTIIGFTVWNNHGKVAWQNRVKITGKILQAGEFIEISSQGVLFKPHPYFCTRKSEMTISMSN